jgi:hypothetical protein
MSTATYQPDDTPASKGYSFCTIAGNPPLWGCSLCDWTFTVEQCNRHSKVLFLEQARAAHNEHLCSQIPAAN